MNPFIRKSIILIPMLTLILLSFFFSSCDTVNRMQRKDDRRISNTKKEIDQRQDNRENEYQKLAERQKKIQDKETRKQMRKLEKKSRRWRENKKEPFFERWYYQWQDNRERRRQD